MRVFIWLLPVGIILYLWRFPRAESRCAVLRILATSMGSGVSLGGLLNALGRETGFWERNKLAQLAEAFDGDLSVAQSIDAMGTYFPAEVQTELRVAEACGVLPQAITRVADEWEARQNRFSSQWDRVFIYLAVVSIVSWGIISFIGIYIVPKLKKIAEDMGVPVREVRTEGIMGMIWTEGSAIASIDWISRIWGWIDFCAMFMAVVLVLACMPMIYHFFTGQRIGSVWGKFASRIWPYRDAVLLLRALRVPIAAGQPLKVAFDELEIHHPYVYMREKIRRLNEEVEEGGSCWVKMWEMKMLNSQQLGLIRSAEERGHLPWVLTELADTMENRMWNRLQMIGEFFQPLGVFFLAIPVIGITWGIMSFLLSILRVL